MHSNSPTSDASGRSNTSDYRLINSSPPTSAVDAGIEVQDELVSSTTTSTQSTKISFSVIRRETSRVVATARNKLDASKEEAEADEVDEHEEISRKRTVLSMEDGVVVHADAPRSKREKKLFVIPVLRLSSQAQIERLRKLVEEGVATESDRARLSLLLESVGDADGGQGGIGQQKIALCEGDLQTGPTVAVADDADPDYNSMPVGEFGLAFLRGCGWKDAQSCIGRSNPQAVPMRVTAPRPKGLGLGAALPSPAPQPSSNAKEGTVEDNEVEKTLGKNSYVKCLGGLNKGAYGQVISMDEENASVFVELAWPSSSVGKTVRISQLAVELVPRREFRDRLKAAARGADDSMSNGQNRKRIRVG